MLTDVIPPIQTSRVYRPARRSARTRSDCCRDEPVENTTLILYFFSNSPMYFPTPRPTPQQIKATTFPSCWAFLRSAAHSLANEPFWANPTVGAVKRMAMAASNAQKLNWIRSFILFLPTRLYLASSAEVLPSGASSRIPPRFTSGARLALVCSSPLSILVSIMG